MFDMVSIVEEKKVVERAVVTDGAMLMFKESLKLTETQTEQNARQINHEEEEWRHDKQHTPETGYQQKFDNQSARRSPVPGPICVVSQMPLAP